MWKRFKEWLRNRLSDFLFGDEVISHSIRTEVQRGDVVIFWYQEPISEQVVTIFKRQFKRCLDVQVVFLPVTVLGPQILGKEKAYEFEKSKEI